MIAPPVWKAEANLGGARPPAVPKENVCARLIRL